MLSPSTPSTSRTYDALLAFHLMMGYGFKADMEMMTKELPKDRDGQAIDLSLYKASARKCALQLLGLVSANKSYVGKAGPKFIHPDPCMLLNFLFCYLCNLHCLI
jgi:hypothetical protein